MSLIAIEDLSFAYPGSYDNVFESVSFRIDTDWRLGFIGRNGRGKTTFLKLLMGEYAYSGKISAGLEFEYFPYPVPDMGACTREVLYTVSPGAADWELERELSCLDIRDGVLDRPFSTLSNGERTKALLAALFLNEGKFLLIDEPTNHLDAEGRRMVSAYLRKKKGFILVSHDRDFLDGCVDHILSINRRSIEVMSGNFSTWSENFQRRQDFEQEKNRRLKKDIARLQESVRRTSGWADKIEAGKIGQGAGDRGFIGHQSARMMGRAKAIESRRERAIQEKSALLKDVEMSGVLKLSPLPYHFSRLVSFRDVAVEYGGRAVCPPVSFEVHQGDRVALSGRNGSGKTSILKLVMGANIGHGGTVTVASGLKLSYVGQDTAGLSGSLADFAREREIDESRFKTILRKMGFERVQFEKDIADFSGGQKKKVLLAGSLCQQAHLYVWDEPMNFIDLFSRMQLEDMLLESRPTLLFVEHDGAFCRNVGTKVIEI